MEKHARSQSRSDDRVKMEVIAQCQPGNFLTYEEIEVMTGVVMDDRGKSIMRRVLYSHEIVYICITGVGIELASIATTLMAIERKGKKAIGAVGVVAETEQRLRHFYPGLSAHDRRIAEMAGIAAATALSQLVGLTERAVERTKTEEFFKQMRRNRNLLGPLPDPDSEDLGPIDA